MADNLATFDPEIVQPADIPSAAPLTDQAAQVMGQMGDVAEKAFQTAIVGPLSTEEEQAAIDNPKGFTPPVALSPAQAQANQLGLQMATQANQSQSMQQMANLRDQTVQQVGINQNTIPTFLAKAQAYTQTQVDSGSPAMRPFIQETAVRTGANVVQSLSRSVQQQAIIQNGLQMKSQDTAVQSSIYDASSNSQGYPTTDDPAQMNVGQGAILAGTQQRTELVERMAEMGMYKSANTMQEALHQIQYDKNAAFLNGELHSSIAEDSAQAAKDQLAGVPFTDSKANDLINGLVKNNPDPDNLTQADLPKLQTFLRGQRNAAAVVSNNEVNQQQTNQSTQVNNSIQGNAIDPQVATESFSDTKAGIAYVNKMTQAGIVGNLADSVNSQPLTAQEGNAKEISAENYQPLETQSNVWNPDDIKSMRTALSSKVNANIQTWKTDPGGATDGSKSWQSHLMNWSVNNYPNVNDQKSVISSASNIPDPSLFVGPNGSPTAGMSPQQVQGMNNILGQKFSYQTKTIGISPDNSQLFSKAQSAQTVTKLMA